MWKCSAVVLLLCAVPAVFAQEASAPSVDPAVVAVWTRADKVASEEATRLLTLLQKTPEYKAYETAVQVRALLRKDMDAQVKAINPAASWDAQAGKLILPTQTAQK